jgi:hypothetical protein
MVVLTVVQSSSVEEDCRSDWAYPGGLTTRLRDRKGVFSGKMMYRPKTRYLSSNDFPIQCQRFHGPPAVGVFGSWQAGAGKCSDGLDNPTCCVCASELSKVTSCLQQVVVVTVLTNV